MTNQQLRIVKMLVMWQERNLKKKYVKQNLGIMDKAKKITLKINR